MQGESSIAVAQGFSYQSCGMYSLIYVRSLVWVYVRVTFVQAFSQFMKQHWGIHTWASIMLSQRSQHFEYLPLPFFSKYPRNDARISYSVHWIHMQREKNHKISMLSCADWRFLQGFCVIVSMCAPIPKIWCGMEVFSGCYTASWNLFNIALCTISFAVFAEAVFNMFQSHVSWLRAQLHPVFAHEFDLVLPAGLGCSVPLCSQSCLGWQTQGCAGASVVPPCMSFPMKIFVSIHHYATLTSSLGTCPKGTRTYIFVLGFSPSVQN